MSDSVEQILARVASGELAPEEALPLLDRAQGHRGPGTARGSRPGTPGATSTDPSGTPGATAGRAFGWTEPGSGVEDDETTPTHPRHTAPGPARQIRVIASYQSVQVEADPTISEAFVVGAHGLQRLGDVLVIASPGLPAALTGAGTDADGPQFSFSTLPRGLAWARNWRDRGLTVRANPNLPLDLEVRASNLRVTGCAAGLRMRLVASKVVLDQVRGPLDLELLSSSLKGTIGPTGRSRVLAESSSVKATLMAGSDLRVHARNQMSKVVLPSGVTRGRFPDGELSSATLGHGRDELQIEALMSSVVIGGWL